MNVNLMRRGKKGLRDCGNVIHHSFSVVHDFSSLTRLWCVTFGKSQLIVFNHVICMEHRRAKQWVHMESSHWTYCISTAQVGQASTIQTNPHLMKNQDEQIKAFGLLYSTTYCISVTWSSKDAARAPLWQGVHRCCVEQLTTLMPRWNHTKAHHYIYFWSRWAKQKASANKKTLEFFQAHLSKWGQIHTQVHNNNLALNMVF